MVADRAPQALDFELSQAYEQFLHGDENEFMVVTASGSYLGHQFWRVLEIDDRTLVVGAIDLYMLYLRQRLQLGKNILQGVTAENTLILDTDVFMQLESEWNNNIMTIDIEKELKGTYCTYQSWLAPASLCFGAHGLNAGVQGSSFFDAKHIIMVCNINGHFVTVRIDMLKWTAELYDPLFHTSNKSAQRGRLEQLAPLLKLWTKVLDCSFYWRHNRIGRTAEERPLNLVVPGHTVQFKQRDSSSSGLFACMHVERFITGSPSIPWGNTHTSQFRKRVATAIFGLCRTPVEEDRAEYAEICRAAAGASQF